MDRSPPRGGSGKAKEAHTPELQLSPQALDHSVAAELRRQWSKESSEQLDVAAREAYADKALAEVAEEGIVPIHGLGIIPRAVLWVALATHPTVRLCDLMHEHDKWYKLLAHAESHVRLYGKA